MADDKKCFIIMPIATSKRMEEKYRGGVKHFDYVYECLFKPSAELRGPALSLMFSGSDRS